MERKFVYKGHYLKSAPGFSWENAKPAEPKELSKKVMALIEDKNLFIGICTKKERVIDDEKLKSKLLCRGEQCGKNDDFSWKTSDWIIQEIGLAFGRGMDVILLVEEGLRLPGGFQGNLEYIQFNRKSPEKSFGKILEMIRALLPKAKLIEASVAKKPKTAEEEEPMEEGVEWLKPKPEWDRSNYEIALMHMVASDDKEGEEEIYKAYQETEEGKQSKNVDSWSAAKEYTHIWWGKDGSLETLEKIAKEKPENSEVQRYLAKGYQSYEKEIKAAVSYKQAAEKEDDEKRKLLRLGEAASAYANAKKKDDLRELIAEIKELAKSIEGGEIILLDILREVAEIQNDKTSYLAYTERLLDLKPDDNKTRFSLAYAHSEEKNNELALYHYLKIPYQSRDLMAWNNLGVANERLDLDGKAVDAYRNSEGKGETLAMDNIAKKLLDAGFFAEAQEQCDKAKRNKNYNKNVDDTLFRLKGNREEEEKKQKEILENIKSTHEFYVKYGHAAVKENISELKGKWVAKQCTLDIEIKNRKLTGYGSYVVPSLDNIFLSKRLGGSSEKTKYEIFYEGDLSGYAVTGTVRISEVGKVAKPTGLLGKDEDTKEIMMVILGDLSKIEVYQESAANESQKFQELVKEPVEK